MTKSKAPARILLVDDDEAISSAYLYFLKNAGYDVVTAGNGTEALRKIKSEKPDLVLLDLIMPVKTGFEVLEALQKNGTLRTLPVIVISNLGQESEIARCMELGAVSYLIKANLSIDGVLKRIKEHLPAGAA